MAACPNINSQEWKDLVSKIGTFEAFKEFYGNNNQIPDAKNYTETFKGVDATLKVVNALSDPKMEKLFNNFYLKGNKDKFFNELIPLAGKQQTNLLREFDNKSPSKDISDMLVNLLLQTEYTIEINTARESARDFADNQGLDEADLREAGIDTESIQNTSYYSSLSVPGGTNYTENEIATPAIVPSIKGHAQFSTDNGIGWFRSDDKHPFTGFLEDLIASGTIKKVPCG